MGGKKNVVLLESRPHVCELQAQNVQVELKFIANLNMFMLSGQTSVSQPQLASGFCLTSGLVTEDII